MASVRSSHLRGWVKDRAEHLAPSTLAMIYQTIVMPMFRAAVIDKVIGSTPCVGVRLPEIPDAKYYIARPEQVHALADALPDLYRPIPYLAAGCGWRAGEVFGLERDAVDLDALEVTVAHQLAVTPGRTPFLAPPKTKTSLRVNELPAEIGAVLRDHLDAFAPAGSSWTTRPTRAGPGRASRTCCSPAATVARSIAARGPTSGGRR